MRDPFAPSAPTKGIDVLTSVAERKMEAWLSKLDDYRDLAIKESDLVVVTGPITKWNDLVERIDRADGLKDAGFKDVSLKDGSLKCLGLEPIKGLADLYDGVLKPLP